MSEIKPALTAEEWAKILRPRINSDGAIVDGSDFYFDEGTRHSRAALALYGQPFGFTREDVRGLEYGGTGYDEGHSDELLDSIARRISALLPPEDK